MGDPNGTTYSTSGSFASTPANLNSNTSLYIGAFGDSSEISACGTIYEVAVSPNYLNSESAFQYIFQLGNSGNLHDLSLSEPFTNKHSPIDSL